MGTLDGPSAPALKPRAGTAKRYTAQLILVTTAEQEGFARTYARLRGVSVTAVLRDLVQGGVDALDPATRAQVAAAMEDDEMVEEGGSSA